jgi:hypothetical protein
MIGWIKAWRERRARRQVSRYTPFERTWLPAARICGFRGVRRTPDGGIEFRDHWQTGASAIYITGDEMAADDWSHAWERCARYRENV